MFSTKTYITTPSSPPHSLVVPPLYFLSRATALMNHLTRTGVAPSRISLSFTRATLTACHAAMLAVEMLDIAAFAMPCF